MSKEQIINDLKSVLVKGVGVKVVNTVAQEAAEDRAKYEALFQLISSDNESTRMKSSWAFAKATEMRPEWGTTYVEPLMDRMEIERTTGVVREIFKAIAESQVPEKWEGRLIDLSFKMLQSPATDLAVKYHAKLVLTKYVKHYPEIKEELISALESVIDAHTEPWKKQVIKSIEKLSKPTRKSRVQIIRAHPSLCCSPAPIVYFFTSHHLLGSGFPLVVLVVPPAGYRFNPLRESKFENKKPHPN